MRVLTLQEPWASLIGEGTKFIETRSWSCYKYGELFIHASIKKIKKSDVHKNNCLKFLRGNLHYGTIFTRCKFTKCVLIDEEFANYIKDNYKECYECGDFTPGRYAWFLEDMHPIKPINASGKLGIWSYDINEYEGENYAIR